jgi:hypothetical protein
MGAGKTSWLIQYINENTDESNYLYITPFLDEVDRIINDVKIPMSQPEYRGGSKEDNLCQLVQRQEDIASTHQLLGNISYETMELIKSNNYTLILDEVMEVITPLDIKKDTVKILKDANCINIDKDGFVIWNLEKTEYNSEPKINRIKNYALKHRLICINDTFLLWQVPPDLFKVFKKIYVMTYLFESSILYYYFRLYGIEYEKKSVTCIDDRYYLTDYEMADTKKYQRLIEVYDGPLNCNFYQKETGMSKSWFRSPKSKKDINQLKNNLNNYFRNKNKATKDNIMWTTFKESATRLHSKGYMYKDIEKHPEAKNKISFVSCNARATNAHDKRYILAYCLNKYANPSLVDYFAKHDIKIDEDLYALSEMLQWIWRSRIRKGESIKIYIPSNRMRRLLCKWLQIELGSENVKRVG